MVIYDEFKPVSVSAFVNEIVCSAGLARLQDSTLH